MTAVPYATLAAVVLAFGLAALLVAVAHRIVHGVLDALDIVGSENRSAVHARAKQLTRALTVLAYGVAALAGISLALERFGVAEPPWHPRLLLRWVLTHGVNLVVILIGAFVAVRTANLAIEHLQFKLSRRHATTDLEWQRRAATLSRILTRLVTTTVGFVAILMILRELAIDVVPILTGAGIAGLAIGFGAQNLVRDVISGFFLILEDQVRIGDFSRINGVAGTVEQINLRTIVLRDGEGAVHVFPNGTITALANFSKQYAYAVVDVKVAYGESLERAIAAAREVGAAMQADPRWKAILLGPLDIVGIDSLADGGAVLRVKFKSLPLHQGPVGNELRQQLVSGFAARGIRPYAA